MEDKRKELETTQSNLLDQRNDQRISASLGVADMFSYYREDVNDRSNSSAFDDLFQSMMTMPSEYDCLVSDDPLQSQFQTSVPRGPTSSPVVNTPATPSSLSMSSSSNEAAVANDDGKSKKNEVTEEERGALDEESNKEKTFMQKLKLGKRNMKKQREPRFAFMTKSDTDHLDDGYRWRKYGQKAVKNSPFPRSYYRCTSPACGVKKRVERSSEDPSTVVTTYEGTHTHLCPIMPRGSYGILPETTTAYGGGIGGAAATSSHFAINNPQILHHNSLVHHNHHHHHHQHSTEVADIIQRNQQGYFHSRTNSSFIDPMVSSTFHQEIKPSSYTSSLARGDGLLQDMLPSQILKVNKDPKED